MAGRSSAFVVAALTTAIVSRCAYSQETVLRDTDSEGVKCLAFSPQGDILASGGHDRAIHLWDVRSGKRLRRIEGHPGPVTCLAFSPNGRILASGSFAARRSDHSLILWDVRSGRILHGIAAANSFDVYAVDFSPDGKTVVSGGDDGLIHSWNVKTGKEQGTQRHGTVTSLSVLPGGQQCVVGGRAKTVFLIDLAAREISRRFTGHDSTAFYVAIPTDGKTLASADEGGTVRLWDISTGKLLRSLDDAGTRIAFSPDGNLFATTHHERPGSPGEIRLWDAKQGKLLDELKGHSDSIEDIEFSPDGKTLASASYDLTIRLWDIARFVDDTSR